jgi:hypothetical protein
LAEGERKVYKCWPLFCADDVNEKMIAVIVTRGCRGCECRPQAVFHRNSSDGQTQ